MEGRRELAIVTGASAGIGAALARELAGAGYDLALVARRADRLVELERELRLAHPQLGIQVVPLDLSRDDAGQALLAAVPQADVLVNNAGAGKFGPALDMDPDEQARLVRLNCESLTRLTLAYLPGMVSRGRGVVLNLASIAGFQPVPYFAVYAASKAYVLSLSQALDEEVRAAGVRVVAVCPGPVPTEFQGLAGSPDAHHTPRLARRSPEEVARVCLEALRRPTRVVTPAWVHGVLQWAYRFVPRDLVTGLAGRSMRRRIAGQAKG